MKVGIAIDYWKLPIFERHLKQAGYSFKVSEAEGIFALTVETDNVEALGIVVKAANDEAALTKGAT